MAIFPKDKKTESVKSPLKYNKKTGVLTKGRTTWELSNEYPYMPEKTIKKAVSITMPWKKDSKKDRFYKINEVSDTSGGEKRIIKSKEVKIDNKGNKTKKKIDGNITTTKIKKAGGNSRISITDASTGRKYSAKNAIAANRKVNKLKRS
jgi:hypothetical protein